MAAGEFAPGIRRAEIGDAALLTELGERTFSETFAKDNRPEDLAQYLALAFGPDLQAAELADPGTIAFLAERDGAAVGYAMLREGAVPACITGALPVELARLYVLKSRLGRGEGEALMSACVEGARRAGYGTMWLGVWEHNARAQAFYRRWKFRYVGEHVFQLGSDPQIDCLMERELSRAAHFRALLRAPLLNRSGSAPRGSPRSPRLQPSEGAETWPPPRARRPRSATSKRSGSCGRCG